MGKCAQQYRELPQSKHAQYSHDCGNENLLLAVNRVVYVMPLRYMYQSHFGHLNCEPPHFNTSMCTND